jgi:type II secretory pathway component GspD/PulD (secretin)
LEIHGISTTIPNNNLISILTASSDAEASAEGITKAKGSIASRFSSGKKTAIDYAIDALEQSGNRQTISCPSALTLDNIEAILETDKVHYFTRSKAKNSNAYNQSTTSKLQAALHIIPGEADGEDKHKMRLFIDMSDGSFDVNEDNQPTAAVIQHSLKSNLYCTKDKA